MFPSDNTTKTLANKYHWQKESFGNNISVPCGTGETAEPFRKINM